MNFTRDASEFEGAGYGLVFFGIVLFLIGLFILTSP
jgi:uncharacterized membrane protein YiaA